MALSNAEKQRRHRERRKSEAVRGRNAESAEIEDIASWLFLAICALDRMTPDSCEEFNIYMRKAANMFRTRRYEGFRAGGMTTITVAEQQAIERIEALIDAFERLRNQ